MRATLGSVIIVLVLVGRSAVAQVLGPFVHGDPTLVGVAYDPVSDPIHLRIDGVEYTLPPSLRPVAATDMTFRVTLADILYSIRIPKFPAQALCDQDPFTTRVATSCDRAMFRLNNGSPISALVGCTTARMTPAEVTVGGEPPPSDAGPGTTPKENDEGGPCSIGGRSPAGALLVALLVVAFRRRARRLRT